MRPLRSIVAIVSGLATVGAMLGHIVFSDADFTTPLSKQ